MLVYNLKQDRFNLQELYEIVVSPEFVQAMSSVGWAAKNEMQFLCYVEAACMEYFKPVWFQNSRHSAAFEEMVRAFNNYRSANNREKAAKKAARKQCITQNVTRSMNQDADLSLVNLGLAISPEPQDVKFVGETLTVFYNKCFSGKRDSEKAEAVNKLKEFVFGMRSGSLKNQTATHIAPMVMHGDDKFQISFSVSSKISKAETIISSIQDVFGSFGNDYPLESDLGYMDMKLCAYVSLLLGESTPIFVQRLLGRINHGPDIDTGEKFVNEYGEYFTDIDLSLEKYVELNPNHVFRKYLMQLYIQSILEDLEILKKYPNDEKSVINFQIQVYITDNLLEILNDRENKFSGALSKASARISELESLLQVQGKELEAARASDHVPSVDSEKVNSLKRRPQKSAAALESALAEAEQLKKDLSQANEEKKMLSEDIDRLSTAYNDLNEQFLNSLEEDGVFIDDEDETAQADESLDQQCSGIRAKLGEESVQELSQKRVIVVGGHEKTISLLKELFPNWEYYGGASDLKSRAWAGDAIACITRYMSHSTFESAKGLARTKAVRLIPVPYTSAASICSHLLKHL